MTSDAFWILLTDALWTAACLLGTYYAFGVFRHAHRAYSFATGALGRANAKKQFRLNQRKAGFLLTAVLLGAFLGFHVVYGDVRDLLSNEPASIDLQSIIYRFILVTMISLVSLALRTLWRIYETWGEE